MKIAIASGKGGTGKTTVAVNLALSLDNVVVLDCDVEEPNSHLFLDVNMEKVKDVTISVPVIDKDICDLCGKCAEFCQYNAIAVLPKDILFFPELCHGCGGCTLVCPKNAIIEKERKLGVIEGGEYAGVKLGLYHGLLNIGEAMATPVISALKDMGEEDGTISKNIIYDSPPGTACPVIETILGSDYCIFVTEPTPFGLHDLKLAVEMIKVLSVPFGVIINKDGLGDDKVQQFCESEKIPILMRIPQSREIAELYSRGTPFISEMPEWKKRFKDMWEEIEGSLENHVAETTGEVKR